jgi:hypothetical protein
VAAVKRASVGASRGAACISGEKRSRPLACGAQGIAGTVLCWGREPGNRTRPPRQTLARDCRRWPVLAQKRAARERRVAAIGDLASTHPPAGRGAPGPHVAAHRAVAIRENVASAFRRHRSDDRDALPPHRDEIDFHRLSFITVIDYRFFNCRGTGVSAAKMVAPRTDPSRSHRNSTRRPVLPSRLTRLSFMRWSAGRRDQHPARADKRKACGPATSRRRSRSAGRRCSGCWQRIELQHRVLWRPDIGQRGTPELPSQGLPPQVGDLHPHDVRGV